MKKLLVTVLAVMATGAAYALPVGNPSEASLLCDGLFFEGNCGDACDPCLSWCDAFSVRIGFYGDYVFNRHMEVDNHPTNQDPDIEDFEIYTNAGYIAFNVWDRADVFATFGASNIVIDTNASAFNSTSGSRFHLETDTDFSWSVGGRISLWECGCTTLGIEGQYFTFKSHIRYADVASATAVYPADTVDAKYHEWQVGLGLSHRINMLVPYVAVKWAGAKWNADNAVLPTTAASTLFDLKNDKEWGFAVGVSLVDCEKAAVTVEGRFADEKAVYVNGQVRF